MLRMRTIDYLHSFSLLLHTKFILAYAEYNSTTHERRTCIYLHKLIECALCCTLIDVTFIIANNVTR